MVRRWTREKVQQSRLLFGSQADKSQQREAEPSDLKRLGKRVARLEPPRKALEADRKNGDHEEKKGHQGVIIRYTYLDKGNEVDRKG